MIVQPLQMGMRNFEVLKDAFADSNARHDDDELFKPVLLV